MARDQDDRRRVGELREASGDPEAVAVREPTGWIVIAAWTAVLALLARAAYRRDTERV